MAELPDGTEHGLALRPIRVVPCELADEIIAEALATLAALERELAAAQTAAGPDGLEAEAHFLIDQAEALVADAREHRAQVMAAARAEAARIIDSAPATSNGHR